MGEGNSVFERLRDALQQRGILFKHTHHAPVFTSAEAAAIRGVELHSGAKALILKAGEAMMMAVVPADLSLDSGALRELLACKRMRFATKEEVFAITGLTPGSIPPFGSLFGLTTICDERLAENESINFNAGSHSDSFQMSYLSYVDYEAPRLARIACAAG